MSFRRARVSRLWATVYSWRFCRCAHELSLQAIVCFLPSWVVLILVIEVKITLSATLCYLYMTHNHHKDDYTYLLDYSLSSVEIVCDASSLSFRCALRRLISSLLCGEWTQNRIHKMGEALRLLFSCHFLTISLNIIGFFQQYLFFHSCLQFISLGGEIILLSSLAD